MMIRIKIGKYRLFIIMNESSTISNRFYWQDRGSFAVRARNEEIGKLYARKGLTQQEIADKLHISQVRVSRILRGKFKFTKKDRGAH